jgi:hypothetical protein
MNLIWQFSVEFMKRVRHRINIHENQNVLNVIRGMRKDRNNSREVVSMENLAILKLLKRQAEESSVVNWREIFLQHQKRLAWERANSITFLALTADNLKKYAENNIFLVVICHIFLRIPCQNSSLREQILVEQGVEAKQTSANMRRSQKVTL